MIAHIRAMFRNLAVPPSTPAQRQPLPSLTAGATYSDLITLREQLTRRHVRAVMTHGRRSAAAVDAMRDLKAVVEEMLRHEVGR